MPLPSPFAEPWRLLLLVRSMRTCKRIQAASKRNAATRGGRHRFAACSHRQHALIDIMGDEVGIRRIDSDVSIHGRGLCVYIEDVNVDLGGAMLPQRPQDASLDRRPRESDRAGNHAREAQHDSHILQRGVPRQSFVAGHPREAGRIVKLHTCRAKPNAEACDAPHHDHACKPGST